jgi:hypothetical protein
VSHKGRANDALLRLLVCEYSLRSAAADAKVPALLPLIPFFLSRHPDHSANQHSRVAMALVLEN